MDFKDYYKVLGVERTATQDEIKRTYRKLARQFHPDVNKDAGAEDRFKEIGEAYEVLGDAEKRAAYDNVGQGFEQGQEFRPPPDWDQGFEFSGARSGAAEHEYSDFFESLFRNAQRQSQSDRQHQRREFHARGSDHHARIYMPLRDAFTGGKRTVTLKVPEIDETGHVAVRERTLNVNIPKGLEEGKSIRLKGQGAPGIGRMPAGDLYLEVFYEPDEVFRLAGKDVYFDLPVTPWEAALGAEVKVPTPAGAIMLKIPPNSFQGREMRIRGRGLPAKQPGDLYAVLQITLPVADTDDAKEAYKEMERKLAFNPRTKLGV